MSRFLSIVCTLGLTLAISCPVAWAAEPSFAGQVAPILMQRCLACHNGKKAEGGYRVDTFEQVLQAGDSEAAPVTANELDGSELYRRITSDDEFERMPLDAEPLSQEQIESIAAWINSGAQCENKLSARPLAAIIPAPTYSAAPETYRRTLPITALAFSPDGTELFVGGYHEITVWNVADGSLSRRIGNIGQRVYGIDVHPAGKQMAIACGQPGRYGEVRIIEIATGNMLAALAGTDDVVFAARYAPAGERLAVATADATVRIYRTVDHQLAHTITSHSDWVMALAWSHDGKLLATASRDKTAKVFDTTDGHSLITYSDHEAEVRGVAFHAEGKQVYSIAANRKLHRWRVADGKREKETGFEGSLFDVVPLEKFLLVAAADNMLHGVARDSGEAKLSYEGHADWVLSAAGHAGAGLVAAGGIDGRVIVWEAENRVKVSEFVAAPGYIP